MHVRSGDQVIVVAGNDKGKTGVVRNVDRKRKRVLVEGVNMRVKHVKPTQQNPQGERVERECPIHVSNVMHLDPNTNKGTRKRPQQA
ncbi:MAG: 50S ribosomal protein L24 [bacterium]|nr:50S ribosomal protein L24 [bacterium]